MKPMIRAAIAAFIYLLGYGTSVAQLSISRLDYELTYDVPQSQVNALVSDLSNPRIRALTTMSGSDQRWDFTGFILSRHDTLTYQRSPASEVLPLGDYFQTANFIVKRLSHLSGRITYNFFDLSQTEVRSLGGAVVNAGVPLANAIVTQIKPAIRVGVFPIAEGTTWSYSYVMDGKQYESRSDVEGWGRLLLPGHQEEDAVRIHAVVTEWMTSNPSAKTVSHTYAYTTVSGKSATIVVGPTGSITRAEISYAPYTTTGVEDRPGLENSLALGQNYPNPIRDRSTVPFTVDHASRVQVSVYNMLGQRIAKLFDAVTPAGPAEVTWDASDVPAGQYMLVVQSEGEMKSRILTRIR